jgi:hypothetical protein
MTRDKGQGTNDKFNDKGQGTRDTWVWGLGFGVWGIENIELGIENYFLFRVRVLEELGVFLMYGGFAVHH